MAKAKTTKAPPKAKAPPKKPTPQKGKATKPAAKPGTKNNPIDPGKRLKEIQGKRKELDTARKEDTAASAAHLATKNKVKDLTEQLFNLTGEDPDQVTLQEQMDADKKK